VPEGKLYIEFISIGIISCVDNWDTWERHNPSGENAEMEQSIMIKMEQSRSLLPPPPSIACLHFVLCTPFNFEQAEQVKSPFKRGGWLRIYETCEYMTYAYACLLLLIKIT
jgi:hypothetical protein